MNIQARLKAGMVSGCVSIAVVFAGCSRDTSRGELVVASPETKGGAKAVSADAMESYIAIQETLAADSMDGVGARAGELAGEFSAMGEAAAADAARSLAQTSDIAEARRQFETVSVTMLSRLKAQGAAGSEYYEAYCPMAFDDRGASWIQADKRVNNPYYGSQMLRCGVIRETFAAAH